MADLREARDGVDRAAARRADRGLHVARQQYEEPLDFIAAVEQVARAGPLPPDAKTTPREVDAPYRMDLDDGVMVNAAGLWPLLQAQWKDPKKWWKDLSTAEGRKDYDWSHLAARWFPARVDEKCRAEPSLAVAHGCFWRYHPETAWRWELRLRHELDDPELRLEAPASDPVREAWLAANAERAEVIRAEERRRWEKKQAAARKKAKAAAAKTPAAKQLGFDLSGGSG